MGANYCDISPEAERLRSIDVKRFVGGWLLGGIAMAERVFVHNPGVLETITNSVGGVALLQTIPPAVRYTLELGHWSKTEQEAPPYRNW